MHVAHRPGDRGFVQGTAKGKCDGVATNAAASAKGSGIRRLPTAAERSEIEALVRAEFIAQKVKSDAAANLKYHNLTALDVDSDGKAELVGTYSVETAPKSRALLFFIADKNASDKYGIGFSDFRIIEEKDVISQDIKDLDSGVYHERLLDIFDTDNDGVAEVFTYVQSFEGAGFNVYRRGGGKW